MNSSIVAQPSPQRIEPHPTGEEFPGFEYRGFWCEVFTNPFMGNLCWGVRVTSGLRFSGTASSETDAQFKAAMQVDEYLEEVEAQQEAERMRHEYDQMIYAGIR